MDREHKLAVLIGASTRLFDLKVMMGSGMEPHAGQPNIRQPFPDLAHSTSDLRQSNSIPKQLCDR
jgi:hypothetical protein